MSTSAPQTPKHYVIVGGVAGGMSAATRLRRLDEQATITVLERSGHVSFANCGLPYHVGGVIEKRSALLLQTPASLAARFNLDVRVRTEAVAIDTARQVVRVRDLAAQAAAEAAAADFRAASKRTSLEAMAGADCAAGATASAARVRRAMSEPSTTGDAGASRRTPAAAPPAAVATVVPGSTTRYDENSVGIPYRSPNDLISWSISLVPPRLRFSAASQPTRCDAHRRATKGLSRVRSGNEARVDQLTGPSTDSPSRRSVAFPSPS